MKQCSASITGVGHYLPTAILTNQELALRVETTDEWIQKRVGISSRHIANADETTVMMATQAARAALDQAGLMASQIELIIVATSTPDDLMPSTASSVQARLGIPLTMAFDISAACSGFIYALHVAHTFFKTQQIQHALIIGAECMSKVLDWSDRSTCVLFGDGAGAVVLSASETPGLIHSCVYSNGTERDLLYINNSTSERYLKMQGNKVFRQAVNLLGDVVETILKISGYQKSDLDWLVPHQANIRIIEATAQKLGLKMSQVIVTLDHHGNTSAASIPLALSEAVSTGRIQRGQLLLLEAFGAGFVWGASLVRYL